MQRVKWKPAFTASACNLGPALQLLLLALKGDGVITSPWTLVLAPVLLALVSLLAFPLTKIRSGATRQARLTVAATVPVILCWVYAVVMTAQELSVSASTDGSIIFVRKM